MNIDEIKQAMQTKLADLQSVSQEKTQALKTDLIQKTEQLTQQLNKLEPWVEKAKQQLNQSETQQKLLDQAVNFEQEFADFEQALNRDGVLEVEVLELNRLFESEAQDKIREHQQAMQQQTDVLGQQIDELLAEMGVQKGKKASKIKALQTRLTPIYQQSKMQLANLLELAAGKLKAA